MEEYIDITDAKYTKWLKRIAVIRLCLKMGAAAIIAVFMVTLFYGLAPYIKGTEEWEDMPWTLSQLEAVITFIVAAWMMHLTLKTITK